MATFHVKTTVLRPKNNQLVNLNPPIIKAICGIIQL